jgi:mono/diheme cytochrome c family protein
VFLPRPDPEASNEELTMKMFKKILKWSGLSLAGLALVLTVTVLVLERRSYDPGYPAVKASSDPAVIARGRYLAYGAAHCVDCHGGLALSGGVEFHLPFGTVRTANITPDRETGIGAMRDEEIARSLRYGVGRNGRTLLPFMPFADLSDEDLTAIVSFLRAQAPVQKRVETRSLNALGHVVLAFAIKPSGPTAPIKARVPAGATAAYGSYLVNSVGNCKGCHTNRDLRTGAFTGPSLAGGLQMESHVDTRTHFVTPNLTPDPATGRIANWTEEIFLARFRTGKGAQDTPMPWPAFARMTDDDIKAIYRYLRSLPPVHNDTGESVRPVQVAQGQ